MRIIACAILFVEISAVLAADPDPLQDFCVADLSPNAPLINGFPCKPRSNVTAKDFYIGFRKPGTQLTDGNDNSQSMYTR